MWEEEGERMEEKDCISNPFIKYSRSSNIQKNIQSQLATRYNNCRDVWVVTRLSYPNLET